MQNDDNITKSVEIIIPAYNAKKTIKRALYSISIQKKIEKIELMVYIVNDGSDYNYNEEVEYFSKYFSIKELKIDKNIGPGYARQFGIDSSFEDYIMFLDADDYLFSPYSIARLYSNINYRNDDLVISRFVHQKETDLIPSEIDYRWLHGKIYSRKFLEDNNIRFNPIRINEDCGFNFLLKFHNPKVSTINDVTYIYAYNENSITRKDNYLCKYTGLEDFCYNMAYAGKEALTKNLDDEYVTITMLRTIITMYFYYLEFHKKYGEANILSWTKMVKEVYDINEKKYIAKELIDEEVEKRKTKYSDEGREYNYVISFDEFFKKVGESKYVGHYNTSL